jgi:hypothetical protein
VTGVFAVLGWRQIVLRRFRGFQPVGVIIVSGAHEAGAGSEYFFREDERESVFLDGQGAGLVDHNTR